jgi:hypothetical protein
MKKIFAFLIPVIAALMFIPALADASNAGDFSGGVAIGTGYAGVDAAPTNGLVVQGNVGLGSTSPSAALDVVGAVKNTTTDTAGSFIPTSSSVPAYGMYAPTATTLAFATNSTTAATIDNNQSVLIGGTTAYTNGASSVPQLQITTTGTGGTGIAIGKYVNDVTNAGSIVIYKSRSGTQGVNTALSVGDTTGVIAFDGADGTNLKNSALIVGVVDNTVSTGVVPGRLDLYTANTSGANTTAIRIDSNQHVNYHGPAYTLSGCGTSPTIAGNDVSGRITLGSAPPASCTVAFSAHWTNTPTCWCNDETTATSCRASANSVAQVTFNGAFAAADKVSFGCSSYF